MAETIRISVANMSCGGCAARAQAALDGVTGIDEVAVNLADHSAQFRLLAPDAQDAAFAALAKAGYPGAPLAEDHSAELHAEQEAEAAQLRRDTLVSVALGLPVFIAEMGSHLFAPLHHAIAQTLGQTNAWLLQWLLTTLVLAGPGRRFFMLGLPALWRRAPDMNSLVALGTAAAYAYSVLAILAPALFPEGARAVYFESACVIVTLILLGRWLEARAKGRTGAAIERLIGLRPDTVRVRTAEGWEDRPLATLATGDVFMVRAGDRIAADATVVEGQGDVDESMLTGEPLPVAKAEGDAVTGGSINGNGTLICRATATGADSKLAQIIAMVQGAQATRLPIQGLVDRITLRFVPAVLLLSALAMLLWALIGPEPRLSYVLVVGVSVLIIACPCAMGLATPTSIMIGTGRAAELGVLFRTGTALQGLQDVTVVAFDKTGTLTEGRPVLADVATAPGMSRTEALRLIAGIEAESRHPVAAAIVAAAEGQAEASAVETLPGRGMRGQVDGAEILVGKEDWLRAEGVDLSLLDAARAQAAAKGQTTVFASRDGQVFALLAIADSVKPNAAAAIAALKARGIRVALISGDNAAAVTHLADALGIDEAIAGVLPGEKADVISRLRGEGARVAFVGDGINDAPALAEADVGIAIGTGTDVAIDAADVVLMAGDPAKVETAITASEQTLRNIRQNLGWAFGYNMLLIPVAAGVLYPLTGMLLSPALAAGAMGLSSVFVVSNALRLRRMAG